MFLVMYLILKILESLGERNTQLSQEHCSEQFNLQISAESRGLEDYTKSVLK